MDVPAAFNRTLSIGFPMVADGGARHEPRAYGGGRRPVAGRHREQRVGACPWDADPHCRGAKEEAAAAEAERLLFLR